MTLGGLTPFQTVGPYLSLGLRAGVVPAVEEGGLVTIRGRLLDGAGHGIPDGVLEFWHPYLCEVRRGLTGGDGSFAVTYRIAPPSDDHCSTSPQSSQSCCGAPPPTATTKTGVRPF